MQSTKNAPSFERVRAMDVKPYRWALWTSFGDESQAFLNEIVGRVWSRDGESLILILESHNSFLVHPDEKIRVCKVTDKPHRTRSFYEAADARDDAAMMKRR